MNRTWLVARQEFIKYITRRGFFISLFMFPIWILAGIFIPRWASETLPQRPFTIVDRAGGYAEILDETLANNLAQRRLLALSQYAATQTDVRRLMRGEPQIGAMLATPNAASSIQKYRSVGGTKAVLIAIAPYQKPNAPPFAEPSARFLPVKAPAPLADAPDSIFPAVAGRYLRGDQHTGLPADEEKLYAIVVIPKDFGNGNTKAEFLTTETSDTDLLNTLQQALTAALRLKAARRLVPQGTQGVEALDVAADVQTSDPTRSADKNEALAQSVGRYLPLGLAIVLFIVSMMNASVLLQGVIEEKSSRMIEVLLSCATPRQILTGKLIGVIAVSLVTIIAWALMLTGFVLFAADDAVAMIGSSLAAVFNAQMLPLLLVYFLCQILIYGTIFLGIGSMANSLADAQALLGPAMIVLILPNLFISPIMQDPSGMIASTASWIPIYTPFVMLIRLSSHPPLAQLIGTAALSIATTAVLIWFVSRIFSRHILSTERPPALAALLRRMLPLRRA